MNKKIIPDAWGHYKILKLSSIGAQECQKTKQKQKNPQKKNSVREKKKKQKQKHRETVGDRLSDLKKR